MNARLLFGRVGVPRMMPFCARCGALSGHWPKDCRVPIPAKL